jgi:hypothetical protein
VEAAAVVAGTAPVLLVVKALAGMELVVRRQVLVPLIVAVAVVVTSGRRV